MEPTANPPASEHTRSAPASKRGPEAPRSDDPPRAARSARGAWSRERWGWGAALVIGAAAAFGAWHPVHETDSIWHVMLGRAVLAAASRTVTEPVAFRAFTEPHVAQEWLFSAAAALVTQLGSWPALVLLTCLLSATCALLLVRIGLRFSVDERRPESALFVAAIGTSVVLYRMTPRPEAMGLCLLAAAVWLTSGWLRASGRAQWGWTAALVALEVVWAQTHGSFIMAPVVFCALGVECFIRPPSSTIRRNALATAGLLTLALASGPEGVGLIGYLATHGGGDATEHIAEWSKLGWSDLDPLGRGDAPLYALLWAVAAAGAIQRRRVDVGAFALALVGVLLVAKAVRFVSPATVLLVPLAARSASELASVWLAKRRWSWAAAAAGLASLALPMRTMGSEQGPLGSAGLAEDANPVLAASWLDRLPAGANVLTTYDAGAWIGLVSSGRVRTYVDSRTPSYFDDTDFALARDLFTSSRALWRGVRRYGAAAIVVQRAPSCPGLEPPPGWGVVVVDPIFTTFAPAEHGPFLTTITPCGQDYLAAEPCAEQGAKLDAEIDTLAALGSSAFVEFLRAARVARCGGDPAPALARLPTDEAAWYFRAQRDWVRGRLLLATGDIDAALVVLEARVREGDRRATAILAEATASGRIPPSRARDLLEASIHIQDEKASPGLRALLAELCVAAEDATCVRFQAVRAAAGGSPRALGPLRWLAQHASSERVAQEAIAWISVLEQEQAAQPGATSAAAGPESGGSPP